MSILLQILLGLGSILIFSGWIFSHASPAEARTTSLDDQLDPRNSFQLGFLMGMAGGLVTDAFVVQHAIQRFEKTHGYKPTLRDAELVIELMHTPRAM